MNGEIVSLVKYICNVLDLGVGSWVQGCSLYHEGRERERRGKEGTVGKENEDHGRIKDGSVLKTIYYE